MKFKSLIIAAALLVSANAHAGAPSYQALANGCGIPNSNDCTKVLVDNMAQATPQALKATSVTFVGSGAGPVVPAAGVITPSTSVPTPAVGNTLTQGNTILAAGAPTAAFVVLPLATASVGKTFTVFNQGSNPLAIVPQTGVINVSGALTPFSCTTIKECTCTGLTTGVFGCSQK